MGGFFLSPVHQVSNFAVQFFISVYSAGFVCQELGLPYPQDLCPQGYYCAAGTSTADPSDAVSTKPIPCQAGLFCLAGVAFPLSVEWIPTQPWGSSFSQPCREGTYCLQGAYQLSGSGLCFPGHYCPPNSTYPVVTPLGTYSPSDGAINPNLCFPGTYAPIVGQFDCLPCPSGYTCPSYGTYIPTICPSGSYRSQVDSVPCKLCQTGTYSLEIGAPDISFCLPCPEGRICQQQGLSNLSDSSACAAGYLCGFGTDASRQYDHDTPGGYYSFNNTSPSHQYDLQCSAGYYCSRGTPAYLANKAKCVIGYYCPKGSPTGSSDDNHCPRVTNSLTGSTLLENCELAAVPVCSKVGIDPRFPMKDLTYYPVFSYSLLDGSNTNVTFDSSILLSNPTGEVVDVAVVDPVNYTASSPSWVNETLDVFRTCPYYGSGNGTNTVVVIGRNFQNTSLNYCKWRACLSANLGINPWRCKNQINEGPGVPLPLISDVSSIAQITLAKFISSTRVECTVPEFLFEPRSAVVESESSDSFFAITGYKCLYVDESGSLMNATFGNISYARPCSSSSTCVNQPFYGWEFFTSIRFKCSATDVSLGICSNNPYTGWMFNPCITGEALVEVTNDGEYFSGGTNLTGISILSTVREIESGTIYMNYKNFTSPAAFAVYTYIQPDKYFYNPSADDMLQNSCLIPLYAEEGPREREAGWFFLELHQVAHVSLDLSAVPGFMLYGQHYRLALFIHSSRCFSSVCDTSGTRVPDEEFVPCKLPSDISQWFDSETVNKNSVLNITVYGLEDIVFSPRIQVLYGLFAPYANLFNETVSVQIETPSRARVRDLDTPSRQISEYVSTQQKLSIMKYIFGSVVYSEDFNYISPPLNLPPKYSDYERGRALLMFNVSSQSTEVPLVLDSTFVDGSTFFNQPAPTADQTKEELDAYFETFHEMQYDPANGYQFTFEIMVIPYFPYFSNCYEFDSYIPFWLAFESSQCSLPESFPLSWYRYNYPPLPDQDHIQYVSSWDVGQNPIADYCVRNLQCNYEETLGNPDPTPRWFEASTGMTLFHFLRDPIDYYQYTGRTSTHPSPYDRGGGGAVRDALAASEDALISVDVDHSAGDAITGCQISCFARSYLFDITYFQINNHEKRIVGATLSGSEYDFNSADTSYSLQLQFRPLGYIDLLLSFQFDISLYFVLSMAVGLVTITICILTWIVARLTTQLQNPPDLKMTGMLGLIAPPALAGVLLALVPIWFLTSLGNLFINGYFYSDPLHPQATAFGSQPLDSYNVDYNNLGQAFYAGEGQICRYGRLGLVFIFIALCCFAAGALKILIIID